MNKMYSVTLLPVISSLSIPRRGSGHHPCQSGQPRDVAAWSESALWTFRTASDRKPADASWLPNEQRPSDKTQPPRGQTASRSTSPKPRHGSEVHGFITQLLVVHLHPTPAHGCQPSPPSSPSLLRLGCCFNPYCHSLGCPGWSYTRQDFSWKHCCLVVFMWHCHGEVRQVCWIGCGRLFFPTKTF